MKHLMILTTALVFGAGFAQAQDASPGSDFMTQWDLDSDGRVSLPEVREQRANIFAMFDESGDGRIDRAEMAAMDAHRQMQRELGMGPGHNRPQGMPKGPGAQRRPPPGFDRPADQLLRGLDADGDGLISEREFTGGSTNWFRQRDRNGDNVLTTADFGPPRG